MRILHVIRTLNPSWGGPVEGVRQMSNIGTALGSSVEVVCMDAADSPWLRSWAIPVHAVGPGHFRYGYTRNLKPWLRRNADRFDAVVVNGIWMYFSLAAQAELTRKNVPFVVFTHGALDPWFKRRYPLKHLKKIVYWKLFEHRVLRDAAATCFTTEEEKLLARGAFTPYKCEEAVVGYGIRPNGFSRENVSALKEEFGNALPQIRGRSYILFLGRIHEKKGIDLLLRAFADARELRRNTALVIAGPGSAAQIEGFRRMSDALLISDDVIWAGPLYENAKWGAFFGATAFALPSHQENFGLSVVEALSCGVPVLISNKVNIWREIMDSGSGLVSTDDTAGVSEMVHRWFNLTQESRTGMETQALRCFSEHFDLDRTIASFHKLLSRNAIASRDRKSSPEQSVTGAHTK